jgi:hypothetical protein
VTLQTALAAWFNRRDMSPGLWTRAHAGEWLCAGFLVAPIAALATACVRWESEGPRSPRVLDLLLVRPQDPDGVFLNEDLVFFFSGEVDRASVTRASIDIRSGGDPARGSLQVDGDRVRFVPAPVLSSDLSDGGYRPGAEYTVAIRGFPEPDGVRGAHGEPLARTRSWSFRTVAVTEPRGGFVFADRQQDRLGVLHMVPPLTGPQDTYQLGTLDAIYLACDKPIDPSTLHDDDFELRSQSKEPSATIPLRVRLIENEPAAALRARPLQARTSSPASGWLRERRAALIELTPKQPPTVGNWSLHVLPARTEHSFCLRDFSGQSILRSRQGPIPIQFVVQAPREAIVSVDFIDRRLRSPVAVAGADGTACWNESGRVEVRYPAAAGSGVDGEVLLDSEESRTDVQATRIELAARRECAWRKESGIAVLRSQGRLTIAGKLVRRVVDASAHAPTEKTLERWHNANDVRKRDIEFPVQTLSEWLAAAQADDLHWTVLIAGGDLVIEGELTVNTPLLLCAGGVVRVSGAVHGVEGSVFLMREGGGLAINPPAAPVPSFLRLDQPVGHNPLRVPLLFAVMTGPIPETGRVARWLPADVGGSRDGEQHKYNGTWRVRYVHESAHAGEVSLDKEGVDSPAALDPPGALQACIELFVQPGGAWDPPFVDYIRLGLDPSGSESPESGERR